ncbi:Uncharacterised protein [Trueperella bialowiezensis]|uniref:Uncharacterized protein n=1 Tax=Trueperella bialowiezensis TaxID=312285 RepID=A0A448PDW3_9ACTO|nr:Uncharacterised protein [Trueperella bialowiezensis]
MEHEARPGYVLWVRLFCRVTCNVRPLSAAELTSSIESMISRQAPMLFSVLSMKFLPGRLILLMIEGILFIRKDATAPGKDLVISRTDWKHEIVGSKC